MTPLMTECSGLWQRTLLIDSDGTHDTSAGVAWLQGITAYVDTRGFAGRLSQRGDVFEWQRLIDIQQLQLDLMQEKQAGRPPKRPLPPLS